MPLSDRERQILDDIEARLQRDDPRFARTVATTTVGSHARRQVKLAVAGFLLGFLLLFAIIVHLAFGVAGFVLMLVSAVHGGNALRRLGQEAQARVGGAVGGGRARPGPGERPSE